MNYLLSAARYPVLAVTALLGACPLFASLESPPPYTEVMDLARGGAGIAAAHELSDWRSYRWTFAEGETELGDFRAVSISNDGQRVLGVVADAQQRQRVVEWSASSSIQSRGVRGFTVPESDVIIALCAEGPAGVGLRPDGLGHLTWIYGPDTFYSVEIVPVPDGFEIGGVVSDGFTTTLFGSAPNATGRVRSRRHGRLRLGFNYMMRAFTPGGSRRPRMMEGIWPGSWSSKGRNTTHSGVFARSSGWSGYRVTLTVGTSSGSRMTASTPIPAIISGTATGSRIHSGVTCAVTDIGPLEQ